VKEITGDKLTSPYIIALVEPENYQKAIDFFGISLTDRADAFGRSILHVAAYRNNYDLVKYLLEYKFNINVLDDNNQTALFYAITVFGPSIDWTNPIIEDETTAKIKFVSDMPYYGNPQAVQQKQVSIVTALLDSGINVNQQNKTGWTVLHFAASFYPEGLRELLVSKGADQGLKTNLSRTANDILAMPR
jgi:ankyrin repeat protein